ncbi:MAG: hypothetical protein ACOC3V_02960 [bacterium]
MKFEKAINEIKIESGDLGHFVKRTTTKEDEELKEKEKKEKRKRSKKRVFGSWFSSHNNKKHIDKR